MISYSHCQHLILFVILLSRLLKLYTTVHRHRGIEKKSQLVSLEFFINTEMSTRNISWGKGGRCVGLTTLPPSCAVVMKYGNLNFLDPCGSLQACNGTAFPFTTRETEYVNCRTTLIVSFIREWPDEIRIKFKLLVQKRYLLRTT